MSLKTLFEKFGEPDENTTSPFDFQSGVTVLAVPEKMLPEISQQAEKPEGTTLNMPPVATTKTIEVHSAPPLMKGLFPHLSEADHKLIMDWLQKASLDANVPDEVRQILINELLTLKADAIKRIPDEEPVEKPSVGGE